MIQKSRKRYTHPSPCGYMGDGLHSCTWPPVMIQRYRRRLSDPLLDRIDLHIEVPRISHKELSDSEEAESSAAIRARVERAREFQRERFAGSNTICNAAMKPRRSASRASVEI